MTEMLNRLMKPWRDSVKNGGMFPLKNSSKKSLPKMRGLPGKVTIKHDEL